MPPATRPVRLIRGTAVAVLALAIVGSACASSNTTTTPATSPAAPVQGTNRGTTPGAAWASAASAPSERGEVAATLADGRIWVAGGFVESGDSVATVESYDVAANTWRVEPSLSTPVNHPMAATHDGVPYVFAGFGSDGKATTAAYRFADGNWARIADLPQARGAGTAVTVGDAIYVAGGIGPDGLVARDLLIYEPATDRWRTGPGMPTPREHLGGAAFGGLVYIVGGREKTTLLDAFEVFDPKTETWKSLPPLPTKRGGLAATATCNGRIVAVGGEDAKTFPEVEAYDVATGTWQRLADLPTPRHGLGVVAADNRVFVIDGGLVPGLADSSINEVLDLGSLGACR